jgi:phage-related holin
MKYILRLLATYEYGSFKELLYSMFPTWKYHLQPLSIFISAVSGLLSYLFGFGPALGFAMLITVIIEVYSGIRASKKEGKDFESFRFSRCILKLALWGILFYIIHAFENEYADRTHVFDLVAYLFFKLIFVGLMTLFVVEHITSILENKAILDNKPKTYFIEFIQDTWKSVLILLKDKIK